MQDKIACWKRSHACRNNTDLLGSQNINTILKVLASMPLELIESGFEELIEDKNFTYKRHNQFKEILEEARCRKYRR